MYSLDDIDYEHHEFTSNLVCPTLLDILRYFPGFGHRGVYSFELDTEINNNNHYIIRFMQFSERTGDKVLLGEWRKNEKERWLWYGDFKNLRLALTLFNGIIHSYKQIRKDVLSSLSLD